MENKEVSSTSNSNLAGRSLIKVKKSNDIKTEPCGSPVRTGAKFDFCPLRNTLCCLILKKLWNNLKRVPDMPKVSSLYKRPSCYTSSNAFKIYIKLPLTSIDRLWLKSESMLWASDNNWFS